MIKYFLFFILLLYGCEFDHEEQGKFFRIDPKELLYKKGDCLAFKVDSGKVIAGLVMDFSKDEGGLWYGICFTNYLDTVIPSIPTIKSYHLYGRKIESTVDAKGYFIGLDLEFLSDSCIRSLNKKVELIGNFKLDTTRIEMGSQSATGDFNQFIQFFKLGRERRLSPPDDYTEQFKLDKFRPDEYFPISHFTNN